jgi:hypothetical protein
MDTSGMNIPRLTAFLCCQRIRQDVVSKNYDLSNVFQGFRPPGYPFGTEFATFARFVHDGSGEYQVEIALADESGAVVSESRPKRIAFGEAPFHDLMTAWRVAFPKAGVYTFKVFINNLNVGESRIYCK